METTLNGYKAFYNGKTTDIYAKSQWDAVLKAREFFKPPKSKAHMVSVVLCELNGETVTHSTVEFG
jgi:hypothetical protein